LAPCWDLLLAIAPGETGTSLVLRTGLFSSACATASASLGPRADCRLTYPLSEPPHAIQLHHRWRVASDCGPILGYVPLADRDFLYILRVRDRSFEVPADVSTSRHVGLSLCHHHRRGCLHVPGPRAREMFLLMTWTSVGMSLLKSFSPPSVIGPQVTMESVFLVLAALVTVWLSDFGKCRLPIWFRPGFNQVTLLSMPSCARVRQHIDARLIAESTRTRSPGIMPARTGVHRSPSTSS